MRQNSRMPSVSIRALRAGDEQRWRGLWAGYLEFYETVLATNVTDIQWQRLLDPAQDPHGLGAVVHDELVGFVHYQHQRTTWLVDDCIYLEDLFVDRSARGAGAELRRATDR